LHILDILIFVVYFLGMLGIGIYFYRSNKSLDDYYIGGRNLGSWHIGLSVVATDVGGGFSIGLGGLGFTMGLSGSWLLFTGLIGAWLAAVLLIPKVYRLSQKHRFFTFPQLFEKLFNKRVALVAGIISAVGYLGFTSSQLLAGAKLASGTFPDLDLTYALSIMGFIAVIYTSLGGLKAVIYTDTIQWIILMIGLIFIAIPFSYFKIGGIQTILDYVPDRFLSLSNLTWQDLVNWGVSIIPIWFVGMTLYQRIYASGSVKQAKKAWFIAGLFEWPIMAFMGVILGLFSRIAFESGMFESAPTAIADFDPEKGLPMLLNEILPIGVMGLILSAYFSAILSTADSCLMAASGNLQTDILGSYFSKKTAGFNLKGSQFITLFIGALAILIAFSMTQVLDLMLTAYAFMVSGLLVPVIMGLYSKNPSANASLAAMIIGGTTTVVLILTETPIPFALDENIIGLSASLITYLLIDNFIKLYRNGIYFIRYR